MPLQDRFFDAAERHLATIRRDAGPAIADAASQVKRVPDAMPAGRHVGRT